MAHSGSVRKMLLVDPVGPLKQYSFRLDKKKKKISEPGYYFSEDFYNRFVEDAQDRQNMREIADPSVEEEQPRSNDVFEFTSERDAPEQTTLKLPNYYNPETIIPYFANKK